MFHAIGSALGLETLMRQKFSQRTFILGNMYMSCAFMLFIHLILVQKIIVSCNLTKIYYQRSV